MTRATGYGDLASDGSDCYILQMRDDNAPWLTAGHNTNGGSMTSTWGYDNIASLYPPHGARATVIEFGLNDVGASIAKETTAENFIGIDTYIKSRGGNCLIGLVSGGENSTAWRETYIPYIQAALDTAGVQYVKMYDAVDTTPGNGTPETLSGDYIADGSHPNAAGHKLIGAAIWAKLTALGWT